MSKSKTFHPAFAVTNITNHIRLTLDVDKVLYAHWKELFINTAKSFSVVDHIIPPKDPSKVTKDDEWERLDAIVKTWIYSTISDDLLHTILTPNTTAQETWDTLADIFEDNKNTRTVHLWAGEEAGEEEGVFRGEAGGVSRGEWGVDRWCWVYGEIVESRNL